MFYLDIVRCILRGTEISDVDETVEFGVPHSFDTLVIDNGALLIHVLNLTFETNVDAYVNNYFFIFRHSMGQLLKNIYLIGYKRKSRYQGKNQNKDLYENNLEIVRISS